MWVDSLLSYYKLLLRYSSVLGPRLCQQDTESVWAAGLANLVLSKVGIWPNIIIHLDFLGGSDGKASVYNVRDLGSIPWVGKIPWRRKWQPTPVLLPWKSHGQRSLVQATIHGVAKSQARLSNFTFTIIYLYLTLLPEVNDQFQVLQFLIFAYFCTFAILLLANKSDFFFFPHSPPIHISWQCKSLNLKTMTKGRYKITIFGSL